MYINWTHWWSDPQNAWFKHHKYTKVAQITKHTGVLWGLDGFRLIYGRKPQGFLNTEA